MLKLLCVFVLVDAFCAPVALAVEPTAVWIDTDPSLLPGGHEVDDGFALIQAFHSSNLSIRGVSAVFGNAPLNIEFPKAQRLVKDFDANAVRVYRGAASAAELGTETEASRALAAALRQQPLVVIAIGPLTNVATVLRNHSELSSRILRLIAVAGRRPHQHFQPNDSAVPFRDFNFELDPAAFQVILDSPVPLVLAPWELSSHVWIRGQDLDALQSAAPALGWVIDAARDWLNYWKQHLKTDGFNPFDTLAVGYAISPAGFHCESLPVQIQSLPNDAIAPGTHQAALKPYLVADAHLSTRSRALYCFQPPPDFARKLIATLEMSRPVAEAFDHSVWNDLTHRYINASHRVDYQTLKNNDLTRLDAYLSQFASKWPSGVTPAETKAALLNLYNALTVRWILANYPVESIWQTKHPFALARNRVNGEMISLDGIESELRSTHDPRIHGALVCAARSCPPLRREAYEPDHVDAQLDDNVREWLRNPALNEFFPQEKTASVSAIFKWYAGDFIKAGSTVKAFLTKFGPAGSVEFLTQPGSTLEYKTYDWGLNDAGSHGSDYSQTRFYWDALRNK
ncbi:MAG: nucleoside hydrolase [Bryobacteraceae bacterium]